MGGREEGGERHSEDRGAQEDGKVSEQAGYLSTACPRRRPGTFAGLE